MRSAFLLFTRERRRGSARPLPDQTQTERATAKRLLPFLYGQKSRFYAGFPAVLFLVIIPFLWYNMHKRF